ncbi:trehalose-6-phosphate synthase, partial [Rhodovulum sulfidophilum]|nr:trehalose-6-phosphate synthase [Rhodovulum sulfidophilum]
IFHAALRKNGGIWMGWSGRSTGEEEPQGLTTLEQDKISYVLTDLSQADLDEYYNGFANRVLWPIFHCRLDLAEYARQEMAGYFRVNRLFADRLVPMLEPDDVIWVHDYHLIPLAQELRKRGVRNRIGFFLHIPWPPADILTALPDRLHARTPFVFGCASKVARVAAYHDLACEETSALFGSRGLFRS